MSQGVIWVLETSYEPTDTDNTIKPKYRIYRKPIQSFSIKTDLFAVDDSAPGQWYDKPVKAKTALFEQLVKTGLEKVFPIVLKSLSKSTFLKCPTSDDQKLFGLSYASVQANLRRFYNAAAAQLLEQMVMVDFTQTVTIDCSPDTEDEEEETVQPVAGYVTEDDDNEETQPVVAQRTPIPIPQENPKPSQKKRGLDTTADFWPFMIETTQVEIDRRVNEHMDPASFAGMSKEAIRAYHERVGELVIVNAQLKFQYKRFCDEKWCLQYINDQSL